MFDLKVIHSVLEQLEDERGIPKDKVLEAIALSLAAAYKKEYGKKGQIVRAIFDNESGKVEFYQVKIVVDRSKIILEDEVDDQNIEELKEEDIRVRFNPEHHILLEDALKMKKDVKVDDEIIFPLESKGDYGRIASQTAKQVIIQKIREAEKTAVMNEYGQKEGEIVSGTVQRTERGIVYIDMGRATGVIPYEEQIPGEKFKQGERVRTYLYAVEESPKGIVLKLSRSHPKLLHKLFEIEAPEIAQGVVEIKAIAREAGSRSKVAVSTTDPHIDPIGAMVGQRGVRVSTVTSELRGEKIDIIEWNEDPKLFIEESISPAKVLDIKVFPEENRAEITVAPEQQSLAIGKGGQNVRLAAKLTGWKIDIRSENVEKPTEKEIGIVDENTENTEVTPE
ncbi:MAG: transcription termination factor NusA [bacterium]|nr:transcription termination factor NusA [bacterium]